MLCRINQAFALVPDGAAVAGVFLDIMQEMMPLRHAAVIVPVSEGGYGVVAGRGDVEQIFRIMETLENERGELAASLTSSCAPGDITPELTVQSLFLRTLPVKYVQRVPMVILAGEEGDVFSPDQIQAVEELLPGFATALDTCALMSGVHDINVLLQSEMSTADQALEDVSRKILQVIDQFSIGLFTLTPDGMVTGINQRASRLLDLAVGQSAGALLGDEILSRFDEDMSDFSQEIAARDRIMRLEFSILSVTPQWRVLVYLRDVTGEGLGDRYRNMVEQAIDAVYLVKNGRFYFGNGKLFDILGYAAEELFGLHFRHVLTSRGMRCLSEALHTHKDQEFLPYLEVEARRHDGRIINLEISLGQWQMDGENSWVGVVRDITSRKELLTLKTRFLNVASHEIRVPLTVIRGYARMLARDTEHVLGEEQRECVDEIEKQCERLLYFSNSLLDFARVSSGKVSLHRERVALNEHLDHVVQTMKVKADEEGVTLRFVGDGRITTLFADPLKLEQAFYNLIDNAIKHSPEGGVVRVMLSLAEEDQRTRAGMLSSDAAVVSVMDQGPGLKPRDAERVFKEFFVGAGACSNRGIGLGLAITREIVHAHGGAVCARPSPHGGLFEVIMPLNVKIN